MRDDGRLTVSAARRLGQGDPHLTADPTYARVLVRRISPHISRAIVVHTSLSADAVTSLSIASGILGALLIVPSTPGTNLLAVLFLQLAYLLDVADGEVARIRGTASRRGTYLDLIGHFLQNRFLYGASAWVLLTVTSFEPWAVVVSLGTMAFSTPFGLYAQIHVLGRTEGEHPEHGSGTRQAVSIRPNGLAGGLRWTYRRLAFLWNYPAAMNLFCLALIVDAALMLTVPGSDPVFLPYGFAVFGASLAVKQVAHALRLLRTPDWTS